MEKNLKDILVCVHHRKNLQVYLQSYFLTFFTFLLTFQEDKKKEKVSLDHVKLDNQN